MAAAAAGDEVELEVGQLQPRDGQRRRKVGDLGGHRGGGGGHLVRLEQAYMTSTICLIDLDPLNPRCLDRIIWVLSFLRILKCPT